MLDFSVLVQRLAQGQPLADMVLAAPTAPEASTPEGPVVTAPVARAAATPEIPAAVDLYQVAEKVYELMKQELGLARDRRAGR